MKLTLKTENFSADSSTEATVSGYDRNDVCRFRVVIKFAEGANQFRVVIKFASAIDLSHYAQAQLILAASTMLDSNFNPDDEPYSEIEIEI